MSLPRGIDERIDWFLSHKPSDFGMCANHSWKSLGGDQGVPPAWGCSDANEVYDKVKASGRYWTGTPKRGALVLWKYGSNGHAAICHNSDGTKICTTDPSNQGSTPTTGVEPITYPHKWGASESARIWTDQYNGVRFEVGDGVDHGDVYLSKLTYGQTDSDSVRRLQLHLNGHPLDGGQNLPVSGNYLEETDEEVRLCQQQHGFGPDPAGGSSVGPKQAGHLFTGCGCVVHDDLPATVPPDPPDPEPAPEPPETISGYTVHRWYSGKKDNEVTVQPGDWRLIDLPAMPPSGVSGKEEHFLYLRILLPKGRSATRTIETYWERSDGDETAYWGPSWDAGAKDSIPYYNFHTEDGTGLGGRWWIKVTGGSDPIKYSTRYAKTTVEYADADTVRASATTRGAAAALAAFWTVASLLALAHITGAL